MVETTQRASVVVRVDSGTRIGAGHLMRCLSLALQLREIGYDVHFVCRCHDGHFSELARSEGFALHLLPLTDGPLSRDTEAPGTHWLGVPWERDSEEVAPILRALKPAWLVVDHYGLDGRWETSLRSLVDAILVIDDLADRPHESDVLLDQNLGASVDAYRTRVGPTCRKLLGPRFALLRPSFRRLALQLAGRDGSLRNVVACAGGSDPKDALSIVVRAWQSLGESRPGLDLIVGASSPNLKRLRHLCDGVANCRLHVQSDRVAETMASGDLLIAAGGSINWERCALSLPAVLFQTAANQASNIRSLVGSRTGFSLGSADHLEPSRLTDLLRRLATKPGLLRRLGRRSGQLVDGLGAYRTAVVMASNRLVLRRAEEADAECAWMWRDQEATRRYFTNPASVPLGQHLDWWRAAIRAVGRSLLIADAGKASIAVVRADHADGEATLSIYLDPTVTGLGLGSKVLRATREWLSRHHPEIRRLHALIDPRNHASQSAFAAAGFAQAGNRWSCEALP